MNTVPHPREMRRFFYDEAASAVERAVRAGETALKLRLTIPETNPEMDVYRIGTVLEMVREIATTLVGGREERCNVVSCRAVMLSWCEPKQ